MVDFNYVIVGAGTAGCVLASRLDDDPGNRATGCSCWSTAAVAWIAANLIREGS